MVAAACDTGATETLRPAADGVERGGTLRIAIGIPGSIEPSNAYEPNGAFVARTMCDSLLAADPVTGDLRPAIAESWQVSDDGSRINLKLRKDATFSSGRQVTPDDVVWSLSRAASAAYAGQAADLLSPIAGFAVIRGNEEAETERDREQLAGVRQSTSSAVEIHLAAPAADYLTVLTHPVAAPLDREAAEADPEGFARAPVCSGPYRVREPASTADGSVIRLERTPGFEGRGTAYVAGGAGFADEIELHVRADQTAAAADVASGALDAVALTSPSEAPAGTEVVSGPSPRMELLALPQGATGPFGERGLRVALSQAIDRERLAADVHGGARAAATRFLPPALGTANLDTDDDRGGAPCRSTVPPSGDVDAARRTLAEAGIDLRQTPLTLTVNGDHDNVRMAEAVAAQWRDAFALDVKVETVTYDALLAKAEQGAFTNPFRVSWTAPVVSADAWLRPLFHTGASNLGNLGRYGNPDFDRLLDEEAREASELDDRRLAYLRAEALLCREVPAIPLTTDVAHFAIRPDRLQKAGETWVDTTTGDLNLREIAVR